MRSLIAGDDEAFSDLQVLRSAAGYFIGTTHTEDGETTPGSRDSGYFETKEAADKYLAMVLSVPNPQEYLRSHP